MCYKTLPDPEKLLTSNSGPWGSASSTTSFEGVSTVGDLGVVQGVEGVEGVPMGMCLGGVVLTPCRSWDCVGKTVCFELNTTLLRTGYCTHHLQSLVVLVQLFFLFLLCLECLLVLLHHPLQPRGDHMTHTHESNMEAIIYMVSTE